MKRFAILAVIALSACATVQETMSADGEVAYAINCSGNGFGWEQCFVAAGDKCGTRGYTILERSNEAAASMHGNKDGFYGEQSTDRSMLITCKK